MNIETKTAIRRAALKAGVATATWQNSDFETWAQIHAPELLESETAPETKIVTKLGIKCCSDIWEARKSLGLPNKGVSHVELAQWVADTSTSCPASTHKEYHTECIRYLNAKDASLIYTRNDSEEPETKPETTKTEGGTTMPKTDVETALETLTKALCGSGITEERVKELIREANSDRRVIDIVFKQEEKEPIKLEGVHFQFPELLMCLKAGENILMKGPAGCGKTHMTTQAAELLEVNYYMQGAVKQEHKVLGFIDANGTYHRTPFRDAFEKGGLFVLEEGDSSSANALLAINNALSSEIADFPDGMVRKHKNFFCVVNCNTWGEGATREYAGRMPLDKASLDRFGFYEVEYDENLEREWISAEFPEFGPQWVAKVQDFRAKVNELGLKHIVSPRASKGGAAMLTEGVSLARVEKMYLHKSMSADELAQMGVK